MATSRRREKEMTALAFNQKEQRVLEKSLATLRLEMGYSLKLLDLHNRTVKVHYRQLKDKVSKIKSHLTPEEINKLRILEAQGKLRPMYPPVGLSSAMKIAAAARRLNSSSVPGTPPKMRAKSALPRMRPGTNDNVDPPPGTLKRRNSITGVFIDIPPPAESRRPGSASGALDRTTSSAGQKTSSGQIERGMSWGENGVDNKAVSNGGSRMVSDAPLNGFRTQTFREPRSVLNGVSTGDKPPISQPSSVYNGRPFSQPAGTSHLEADRTKIHSQSFTSISYPRAPTAPHTRAPFSSHVVTEKEAREQTEVEANGSNGAFMTTSSASRERRLSHVELDDSVKDALGEDLFAERRAELLEEEQYKSAELERRKDLFLKEVDRYLRENPPFAPVIQSPTPLPTSVSFERHKEDGGIDGISDELYPRRRLHVEFDSTPTYLPEEDYRERLMGLWRDMNKCRYLRVPDEMIDLSGINTLAANHMTLFRILKNQKPEPLSSAWQ